MKLSPNPKPFHLSRGDRGKITVCDFLDKSGYEIVEKNHKSRLGEIDVIAARKGRVAFIEIKTRTNTQFGHPQKAANLKN
jgi:putative endonuclease